MSRHGPERINGIRPPEPIERWTATTGRTFETFVAETVRSGLTVGVEDWREKFRSARENAPGKIRETKRPLNWAGQTAGRAVVRNPRSPGLKTSDELGEFLLGAENALRETKGREGTSSQAQAENRGSGPRRTGHPTRESLPESRAECWVSEPASHRTAVTEAPPA